MIKKLLCLLVAMLGMALQGRAQELKVPVWERFVRVNKEGINLRKAPNATSAKLFYEERMGALEGNAYSWQPQSGYSPYSPYRGQILPVIKEENGWYLVHLDYETDAYVNKNFCNDVTPQNINYGGTDRLKRILGNQNLYAHWEQNALYQACWFGRQYGVGIVWGQYDIDEGFKFLHKECGIKAETSGPFYVNLDEVNAKKIQEAHLISFLNANKPIEQMMALTYNFLDQAGEHIYTYWFK